ncbi:Cyclophilin-like peptidyl-prolyl cis-trans isomerase domain [Pseudocohnilembus persalinus]|uniref:peptidylprolyl isomerase n=1 Tax=Pseudocohnilembus persalinus TaxID=266149 RepID=A0A0V0R6V5_PSEPJ|nr:Cyclophilin-like peptidyl-prolyl cis-trans isomerase domain [Pseudocohnilembus persalinus]|eukprot:KRX10096.1 Cyclophilin-like peptidyl-prolyl cis-trans isomerase domain [Pseudocohnilembus persalinus]
MAEFVNITEDGGVQKKILQEGQGDSTPANGNNIQVTYIGTLEDGTQFDSNTDKENAFEFKVGVGQVIKGWDLGMVTMKKGERALFKLSSEYAYGASGSPPKIPPNATLIFEVEMLDWFMNKGDYPESERFEFAAKCKQEGNNFYKNKELQQAQDKYTEGIEWLETMYDNSKAMEDQRIIRNNLAAVHLAQGNANGAINQTSKILEAEPENQKALFRRGQAYRMTKNYEAAKTDLKLLYKLDPKNNACISELQAVQKALKAQQEKEKSTFSGLFKNSMYTDKPDPKITKIVDNPSSPSNPKVFMDIKIGESDSERVEIELYKNVVPKTAENFQYLIENKFKNCIFHRNIKNFMIQGGDYENANGTGGQSKFGEKFEDENFNVLHKKRGQLSMANAGPNTNGSQFFMLYTQTPHLDGKHVVFGEITKNIEILDKLEAVETDAGDKPKQDIVIVDCGLVGRNMMKNGGGIMKMPKNLLLYFVEFLNIKDFLYLCLTNKQFYTELFKDEQGIIWKNFAIKYYILNKNIKLPAYFNNEIYVKKQDQTIYKQLVKYCLCKYTEYKQIIDNNLQNKLKIDLQEYQENLLQHFERVVKIVTDFYGKKELLEKIGKADESFNIPLDYFIFLSIYDLNKIQTDYEEIGFLGGLSFYDFSSQTYAKTKIAYKNNLILHQIGKISENFGVYIDVDNFLKEETNESIFIKFDYEPNVSFVHVYSNTFDEFIKQIKNYELNPYDNYLDVMDTTHFPDSDKTTKGIRVRVCCKYMPGLGESFQKFFYIYQIRISDDGIEEGKQYKLISRYWKIKQMGQEEIVQGEGVIGKYPIMYKGCNDFIYASCNQLQCQTGSMEGHFIFKNIHDLSDEIKVEIPQFQLALKQQERVFYIDFEKNEKIQVYPPIVLIDEE